VMMENHSYDDHFGMLKRGDGFKLGSDGLPLDANPYNGRLLKAFHMPSSCQLERVPSQAWNASHTAFDDGRNDGFVKASGPVAMGYWDSTDIPFYYGLAETFPVCDRFFCSVLAQTYPNRRFLIAGTAAGIVSTTTEALTAPEPPNGTIFDRLDAHHIDYRIYYQNVPSWLIVPDILKPKGRADRQRKYSTFHADAAAGRLPAFTFIDPEYDTTSEENPQDIQVGERFVADVVRTLMRAPTWKNTVLFLNYDEHGGYYDHVAPPRAIKPDSTPPLLNPGDTPGAYDRYGFRVPLIVVSPWAKPNYVSNVVQDHTSITAFIERKWNLPAMTFRDANAQPMTDYFDFSKPAFEKPPALAKAPALAPGLAACHAQGLNPPLPAGVG
jgi:phospholipase C